MPSIRERFMKWKKNRDYNIANKEAREKYKTNMPNQASPRRNLFSLGKGRTKRRPPTKRHRHKKSRKRKRRQSRKRH